MHPTVFVLGRAYSDFDMRREMTAAQRILFCEPSETLGTTDPRKVGRRAPFSSTLLEPRRLSRVIGHDESQTVRCVFDVSFSGRYLLVTPFLVLGVEATPKYNDDTWVGVWCYRVT